jgi:3-oxoacid CoA-transferase subunit A
MKKMMTVETEVSEDNMVKYYITGDKHRHFDTLINFCRNNNTKKSDVIIILGDAGINYYGDSRDAELKKRLSKVNITLFCIHGNKENRPENIKSYLIKNFCGGKVYYEPKYPNLYFAKDGEIYDFGGHEYMVVGGAHSVDKQMCLGEGLPYWEDEMPEPEIREAVEKKLYQMDWKIYGLLTHTCPASYMPSEVFLSAQDSDGEDECSISGKEYKFDIDQSTEVWFEGILRKLDYSVWYCGHFHTEKKTSKINILHKSIKSLCVEETPDE